MTDRPSKDSYGDMIDKLKRKKPFPEPKPIKEHPPKRLWPPDDTEPR